MVVRSLLVCSAVCLFALAAPRARADSDAVPSVAGAWSGKITSVYWDQTNDSSVHPKKKYKSSVDVTITQVGPQIEMTLSFGEDFPVDASSVLSSLVLEGFVGNYHASAGEDPTLTLPAVLLSGTSNKKADRLTWTGTAASTEFTHQITIKLKKTSK
jgi:hypothetical protein